MVVVARGLERATARGEKEADVDGRGCEVCDRVPVAPITVRRHVGMIVLQKFYKVNAQLCRDHGRAVAKEYLGKTLLLGWWGVISFFVNFYAVYTDVRALAKASALEPPVARQPVTTDDSNLARVDQGPAQLTTATTPPAGWYKDPAQRYELRYSDGAQWTEHVSSQGVQAVDPIR